MNYIKRGLLSVYRNRGKSLLLLLTIFILGNVIAGSVAIKQAAIKTEQVTKEKLGADITISEDYEKLMKDSENGVFLGRAEPLSKELIELLGESDKIRYYDYSTYGMFNSEGLKRYKSENKNNNVSMFGGDSGFMFNGVNYNKIMDIEKGTIELVDGRHFTEEEVAEGSKVIVISDKLAKLNDLKVGDTITFTHEILDYSGAGAIITSDTQSENSSKPKVLDSRDLEFEIIGLYKQTEFELKDDIENSDSLEDIMNMENLNNIYTTNKVIQSEDLFRESTLKEHLPDYEDEQATWYSPTFVLNSPDDIDEFTKEAEAVIPDSYKVNSSRDEYDNVAGPIMAVAAIAQIVLVVAVGASIVIIGLMVMLFLRDRKQELGIYISLGESRTKVMSQIIIEVMVIAVMGLSLSLLSGNYLASGVSNTMIQQQLHKEDTGNMGGMMPAVSVGMGKSNLSEEEVIEAYQIDLDSTYVAIFMSVSMITVLISTIIPIMYITNLKPKEILL